jgi:hypothetical protein
MPWASIGLSAVAVLIEASVLIAVLMPGAIPRLAAAVAALGLLAGFYLFQGIFWPAWWLLTLGLLPWQWLDRELRGPAAAPAAPVARTPRAALSRVQQTAIILLLAQQLIASTMKLELRPLLSAYDMYSTSYASPAVFDKTSPDLRYRMVAEETGGPRTDITECVEELPGNVFTLLRDTRGTDSIHADALSTCVSASEAPARYLVLEDWRAFDWTTGRYYWRYRDKVTATVPASAPVTRIR